MEIIIVIGIVGILAAISVPIFTKAMERARVREAISQLKLLQTAEKVVKVEEGKYKSCGNTSACNSILRLDLPTADWDYSVVTAGVSSGFRANAKRKSGQWAGCTYSIDGPTGDPYVSSGANTCP